ncbi:HEAT repeat domain-containing protein [Pedobacter sp. L105]|uniref:HEAT repeat domain-containing protein n=1 Tax=Pedobacter sp. L105 TaxID=1641871 RepID=UPI00131C2142|nr:HEAT repeat domain-containing protein [Pedobacter sp. L105]
MEDDLEKFIQHNRDAFDHKTPPPVVLNRILEQMKPNVEKKPAGILISFQMIRWAVACLILVACGITFLTLHNKPDNTVLVSTKAPIRQRENPTENSVQKPEVTATSPTKPVQKSIDAIEQDLATRKQALVAKLKAQNSTSKKLVVFEGLHNMESSASRITATEAVRQLKNQGNDVVDALVQTLNSDPNANVRLAALDGLTRFYQDNYVRQQLIASLKKQHDPMVQITMINLLTRMQESGILTELEKIVNDQNTQKAVKDCAYSGILQLQSS